jgi:flagellar secretion chaperone FliS
VGRGGCTLNSARGRSITSGVSYQATAMRAYRESSVMTAPPERLVVMLYDGALRFLARATAEMREGRHVAAGQPLSRAEAILDELLATLDMDQGEVAERLQAIYVFCRRLLIEARLERDAERIEKVSHLLGELRDAWNQACGG